MLMRTVIWFLLCLSVISKGSQCHSRHPAESQQQHADFRSHPSSRPMVQEKEDEIYLESVEDLEHVTYLSMRNFNITDDDLVQTSWSGNINAANAHKQHQKATPSLGGSELKSRLSMMLESFILHIRNGHLRRLELDELREIAYATSHKIVAETSDTQTQQVTAGLANGTAALNASEWLVGSSKESHAGNFSTQQRLRDDGAVQDRCHFLVSIYSSELNHRHRQAIEAERRGSQIQYETQQNVDGGNSPLGAASNEKPIEINVDRLTKLCRLVVECQTGEDLINLITGPSWKSSSGSIRKRSSLELGSTADAYQKLDGIEDHSKRPKNLRESLSLSLAKLCPLILFQLHEDEGICAVRRDDRPSLVTVWGFATLFVTIVSFCSLIGLSITPLLGPTVSESDSSASSNSSENSEKRPKEARVTNISPAYDQSKRARLTLFEGLAVGSLVGSALFSLIPQAFELQERESNHSFLLKALIIFLGIYLFFLSEGIVRIILEARQRRKKLKRIGHHGSTSVPLPSGGYEFSPPEPMMHPALMDQRRWHLRPVMQDQISHNGTRSRSHVSKSTTSFTGTHRTRNADGKLAVGAQAKTNQADFDSAKSVRFRSKERREFANNKKTTKPTSRGTSSRRARRRRARQSVVEAKRLRRKHVSVPQMPLPSSERPMCRTSSSLSISSSLSSSSNSSVSIPSVRRHEIKLGTGENLQLDSCGIMSAYNSSNEDGNYDLSDFSEDDDHLPQVRAINEQMSKYTSRLESQEKRTGRSPTFQLVQEPMGHNFRGTKATPKQDISTVAWMIILGDGLHNFIDGISIGAAFSESILSGVSISVAVICEEFPHELGDFAVLVSSGMTVHQALGYNFLSACTCYVGMAVGIILGDVNDSASYVSAFAAGVFLYIALVDMMGELSVALEDTSRGSITGTFKLLLLQNVGVFIGISIILVLSFIDF